MRYCATAGSRPGPRYGFATYFHPGQGLDHWITEYRDDKDERWVCADTEITGAGILKEPEGLWPGQFLSGGEAWQAFRAGRLRSPGGLAGTVQATISTGDEPAAEVAWVAGTRWQAQGIATGAARALVAWLGQQ